VVVLIGDHGYHNGDHAMWHKMTLFETSHRVPFLLYAPGAKGNGKRVAGLVELLDLYPTLAALCGLTPPKHLEGTDLRPWLEDPGRRSRPAAFGIVGRNDDGTQSHHKPEYFGRTIRTERWRYTEWDEGRRGVELYDEAADPGETANLANEAKYSGVIKELQQRLRARR
jgi:iduronate 2-sulfatase